MGSLAWRDRLPPEARRRLGRIKRAVLDEPEQPAPGRRTPRRSVPPQRRTPVGVADPPPDVTRLELRRRCVLADQPPDCSILEIGPAHNAILPKREGYRTRTVDYLDRAGLVEKYREHTQYDPDDIEEVDYVLPPGAKMAEAIDERFDVVVASHVLEHTTSLIGFLNECERLLNPGGVVALVVPDHRYCFDRFRSRSGLGQVIDAELNPQPVHSVGTLVEFTLNAVKHRGTTSWAPGHRGRYAFAHDLDGALANAERAKGSEYIDVHHWVLSPHYLRLMLSDLFDLGYLQLRECSFHPTVGHEFFLNLSPRGAGPSRTRQELLVLADGEARSTDVPVFIPPSVDAEGERGRS